MASHESKNVSGQKMAISLRSWVMVALTLIFVCMYGAALIGWLQPLADDKMVARLEPMIFVIIGYYFGRLPGQQNEKTLKDEIGRQTEKADNAQREKEEAQQNKGALQEKVKNAKAALASAPPVTGLSPTLSKERGAVPEAALRQSLAAALNVLES